MICSSYSEYRGTAVSLAMQTVQCLPSLGFREMSELVVHLVALLVVSVLEMSDDSPALLQRAGLHHCRGHTTLSIQLVTATRNSTVTPLYVKCNNVYQCKNYPNITEAPTSSDQ